MNDPRPSPYHAGQPVLLVAGKRTYRATVVAVLPFDASVRRWRYQVQVDGLGLVQTDETALRMDSSRPDPPQEEAQL